MGTGAELAIYAIYAAAIVGSTAVTIDAQNKQAKSAENIAEFNAKIAENAGIQADMEHREQIARMRKNNERLKATAVTKVATSGVIFEGSPLDVLGENAAHLELAVLDEARLGEVALRNSTATATATRFEGASIASGLRNKSIATGISGVTQLANTGIQSGAFA